MRLKLDTFWKCLLNKLLNGTSLILTWATAWSHITVHPKSLNGCSLIKRSLEKMSFHMNCIYTHTVQHTTHITDCHNQAKNFKRKIVPGACSNWLKNPGLARYFVRHNISALSGNKSDEHLLKRAVLFLLQEETGKNQWSRLTMKNTWNLTSVSLLTLMHPTYFLSSCSRKQVSYLTCFFLVWHFISGVDVIVVKPKILNVN